MKTAAALLLSVLSAPVAAFSTAQQSARLSVSLGAAKSEALPFMNKPATLDGTMAGDVGFDPLGLSTIDAVGIDLYWLREAEIKHCRVAMMAAAGNIWVEAFGPAPGCEMATAKNQMDAFWQFWDEQPQYIAFGLIMIGIVEMVSGIAATSGRASGERAPGDFGLDPLKYANGGAEKFEKLKLQEIKNGRLAMWAAAGQLMQGMTTDDGAIGNFISTFS